MPKEMIWRSEVRKESSSEVDVAYPPIDDDDGEVFEWLRSLYLVLYELEE